MIRAMRKDDLPELVRLGKLLHETSTYWCFQYDEQKVAEFLSGLVASGTGVVFVAERDGKVIGGFAGGIVEWWFSRDRLAFDLSLFVHPKHRHGLIAMKLIKAFEAWAKDKGAIEVRLGITTNIGVAGTARLYKSMGFENAGVTFGKGLDDGDGSSVVGGDRGSSVVGRGLH